MYKHALHFESLNHAEQAQRFIAGLKVGVGESRIFEISHVWCLEFKTAGPLPKSVQARIVGHTQPNTPAFDMVEVEISDHVKELHGRVKADA